MLRFICLAISIFSVASFGLGQTIDGLVKQDHYAELEGKPIEIQIAGQRSPYVGELVKTVTQKKTGNLNSIAIKSERQLREPSANKS